MKQEYIECSAFQTQNERKTILPAIVVLPHINAFEVKINPSELEWELQVDMVGRMLIRYQPQSDLFTDLQELLLLHRPKDNRCRIEKLRSYYWVSSTNFEEEKKEESQSRKNIEQGEVRQKFHHNFPQNRLTDHRINKAFTTLRTYRQR